MTFLVFQRSVCGFLEAVFAISNNLTNTAMRTVLLNVFLLLHTIVADKQEILRACHSRNESYALSIIANGTDGEPFELDAKLNDLGDTALIFCVSFQAEAVALKLIELGADVTHRTSTGDSALSWAAHRNLPNVVKSLLLKGADPNVLVDGMSPLYYSCRDNATEIATMLLEIGKADPNLGQQNGIGSLAQAIANNNANVTSALLKRGASTELLILSGPAAGNSPVTLCKNAAEKSEEMSRVCSEVFKISAAIATKKEIDRAKESLVTICSVEKKKKLKVEENKEVTANEAAEGAKEIEQALAALVSLQNIKGAIKNVEGPETRTALQIAVTCKNDFVGDALRKALSEGSEDPRSTFFEWLFNTWHPKKLETSKDDVKDL